MFFDNPSSRSILINQSIRLKSFIYKYRFFVDSAGKKRIGNFEKRAVKRERERDIARARVFERVRTRREFEIRGTRSRHREEDARRQAVYSYSVSDL